MMTAAAEQDKVKLISAIDVRGKNNNADDPDKKNKDGGDSDGDGDGDGGTMLANKSICILLTQEYLGCSWQLARGGIHNRFGNQVYEVYGRSKSVTAILDAIITDTQAILYFIRTWAWVSSIGGRRGISTLSLIENR